MMNKSVEKLYKEDAVYRVVFDIVEGRIKVGKVISAKINELLSNEGKLATTFELYSLLKLNEVEKAFDPDRGIKLETFVKTCLNNTLVSKYRRGKIRDIYLTEEDHNIDIHDDLDSNINTEEVIDLFKQFYGTEIIDVLIEANELVGDYSITEAIWAIGKGEQYNSVYKKLRRSRPKFEKFLATKGIELVETEHGLYFNYK